MTSPSRPDAEERATPDSSGRYAWYWRIWILVAVFCAVALVGSLIVDIPIRDPGNAFFLGKVAIAFGAMVFLALVDAVIQSRPKPSLRGIGNALAERWTRRRLVLATTGIVAYYLVYTAYRNLKSWDIFRGPFDEMLDSWDRWLLFGNSPAVVLHNLFGDDTAMYVLTFVYRSFTPLYTAFLVGALVFSRSIRHGFVMLVASMWGWILGTVSYYAIPSLGPFWLSPEEFAGLPQTSIQEMQADIVERRLLLLADPQGAEVMSGISAFASLHTAITAIVWLMCLYYGLRKTSWAVGIFLVLTMVATLYHGWHYIADDVAGLAIAYASVFLARKMIYPGGVGEPLHGRALREKASQPVAQ